MAVDDYLDDSSPNTSVAATFGWPIAEWCVSSITDFSNVFSAARNPLAAGFNESLAGWNTSRATSMFRMFEGTAAFNQDLSEWEVSRVRTMGRMF